MPTKKQRRRNRPRRRFALWLTLTVVTWNTHTSVALRNGGLAWLRGNLGRRVHVLLLQEAHDHAALVRALGPFAGWRWTLLPTYQPGKRGTYVAVRRARFKVLERYDRDATCNEKHERRCVGALLFDRFTRRTVFVSSIHVAPLGKGLTGADPGARERQARQISEWVDLATEVDRRLDEGVGLIGGDTNQRLDHAHALNGSLREYDVHRRFGELGYAAAHRLVGGPVRLDDVFVRSVPWVRTKVRRMIDVPVAGNDHAAVMVVFKVRRLGGRRRKKK